ncbi:UDP-N-acetylmuramate--L-alanine ligase [Aeromicrobium sp. IC_218]|uniref:UDP-N-acetylmuramate--L-alanine ligase n=1 Tax=Aeromicrobium sp. IC_218 TaxID=2545468 RepID=UPI00103ACD77|nr:UDP-N-acetylmuramate--L-alanine ligase [Aeromicrobium sp. IC_218]TCI99758.1 UDP-N-acetylmuramate--L-alanine ligase [Aeromicrobium sp. IC_218]
MRIDVPEHVVPAAELRRVHLVGVGGAGLSAIARLLAARGVEVSGSDAHDSAVLQALRSEGVTGHVGHAAEHVGDVDAVIASTAVREDNPEVVAALERGVALWPRSAGMQSVLTGHRVVAVAGTHGKTTTTAMLAVALTEAGLDPSYAIGAEVPALGTNAHLGGELFVAEADESDGAFLVYTPAVGVVTNVDADHLDTWGTVEAYEEAFEQFVSHLGEAVVLCADDPVAVRLAGPARERGLRVVTAGLADDADVRASDLRVEGGRTSFDVIAFGEPLGRAELAVPGRHYAVDALLALAAGLVVGGDPAALLRGLGRHQGAKRRMEHRGDAGGVRVYDSYAHHPTEIAADLEAARSLAGDDRLVVAFQPHLVSRTRTHGAAMGRALAAADEVLVADIYLAREDPDPEVTAALVVEAAGAEHVRAGGSLDDVERELVRVLRPGDLLLTLGAGDVTTLGPAVLAALETR